MKIEGEALLDPGTGRWYIVMRAVQHDGGVKELRKSPPVFPTREEAEKEIVASLREAKEMP